MDMKQWSSFLLDTKHVDVNSVDRWKQTPVSRAAQLGYEAVVKLLLATERIAVNSRDSYGFTPLIYAALGHAHVDSIDFSGKTPLSYAAKRGHEAVVKLLISAGHVH
jgi:ankyrin repeat protein